jgi:membrane-bound serine protease (ClpP class)
MTLLWVVLMFVAACLLILTEFLLPGGILGFAGAALLVGGCIYGMLNVPQYGVFILIGETLGAVLTICLGMYLLANTKAGSAFRLDTALSNEAGYENMPTDTSLIGQTGMAITPLRPAGIIEIDGRRLDVTANGDFIATGETVKVVAVNGNYITVERPEESAA